VGGLGQENLEESCRSPRCRCQLVRFFGHRLLFGLGDCRDSSGGVGASASEDNADGDLRPQVGVVWPCMSWGRVAVDQDKFHGSNGIAGCTVLARFVSRDMSSETADFLRPM
jgi:hypothetical protein